MVQIENKYNFEHENQAEIGPSSNLERNYQMFDLEAKNRTNNINQRKSFIQKIFNKNKVVREDIIKKKVAELDRIANSGEPDLSIKSALLSNGRENEMHRQTRYIKEKFLMIFEAFSENNFEVAFNNYKYIARNLGFKENKEYLDKLIDLSKKK